jgi:hypothetical protein
MPEAVVMCQTPVRSWMWQGLLNLIVCHSIICGNGVSHRCVLWTLAALVGNKDYIYVEIFLRTFRFVGSLVVALWRCLDTYTHVHHPQTGWWSHKLTFFLKKEIGYKIRCMRSSCCLCVSSFTLWTNWPIFTNFGANVMTLVAIQTSCF